jgi:hypothetical protein|tara:strand:+ start:539 stop:916 length:378 start_codon:yes stop_codon:yes gene_type:complete
MGSRNDFNKLFDEFQACEFFNDAMHTLSWIESVSGGIDRVTGIQTTTDTVYSADSFLLSPSKSERPSAQIFRDIQAGDIVVVSQITEMIKKPKLNSIMTFDSEDFTVKEIVSDSVGVTWKFLLRN